MRRARDLRPRGVEGLAGGRRDETYGGVYLWADRESFEAYTRGEIFAGIGSNPGFANVTSRDFGVLDAPTAITSALAGAGV